MDTSCFTCAWFTRTRFIRTGETTPLNYGYGAIGICRRYPPNGPSSTYANKDQEKPTLEFGQCFEPIWEETAIGCGEWKCHPDLVAKRTSDFANSFQAADTSSPK